MDSSSKLVRQFLTAFVGIHLVICLLAVVLLGPAAMTNDRYMKSARATRWYETNQTTIPFATPDELQMSLSGQLSDFPLALGTTWIYSSTYYDTWTSGEYGADNFTTKRITATYRITETVQNIKKDSPYNIIELERSQSVITSSVNLGDSRYDNYLLGKTWDTSRWYIISGTTVFLQHKLDLSIIPSSGPIYLFPLIDGQSWQFSPELPRIYHLVMASEALSTPIGRFDDCFHIRTVFLSGPLHKWFCNGTGVVKEKYDHQGTPYGYEQILVDFVLPKP
ncbi:MAG: hypothetical protein H6658_11075 [Ardenticatenaceae bacterium]|nr:hypothetical protein [Ardenticatenaceae bacterium]